MFLSCMSSDWSIAWFSLITFWLAWRDYFTAGNMISFSIVFIWKQRFLYTVNKAFLPQVYERKRLKRYGFQKHRPKKRILKSESYCLRVDGINGQRWRFLYSLGFPLHLNHRKRRISKTMPDVTKIGRVTTEQRFRLFSIVDVWTVKTDTLL